jgi:hypothetical protein
MSMPPSADVPPDPTAPPTAPMTPVSRPAPPPPHSGPPAFSEPPVAPATPAPLVPGTPATAYPGGSAPATAGDPLVLPPGSTFGAWFTKLQEVAKRSWRSALIICAVGIAAPYAVAAFFSQVFSWGGYTLFGAGTFFDVLGSLLLGWVVAFAVAVAGCFVAAAGWAAGTWAVTQEAATGRPANVGQAFSYGLKRAMALFPWTVLAALAFAIGSACLFLPGVYLAFGFSMFGLVAVFERGQNPVARSFSLTHNSAAIGPTLGRVGILFAVSWLYLLVVNLIELGLQVAVSIGNVGGLANRVADGVIEAGGALLAAPVFAVLLLGLLTTYAELRAREGQVSTGTLARELER